MNCFDVQEKIIDMVIGELSPEEEAEIREHTAHCPMCREELHMLTTCMQTCITEESETCECRFQDTYWEDFVVTMHKKISHEKIESKYPFKIILPVAVSVLAAATIGYFLFVQPKPEETVDSEAPSYYEYDPYDEMDELSPEETEQLIKIINQKYGP
jgi:hypothetical protein